MVRNGLKFRSNLLPAGVSSALTEAFALKIKLLTLTTASGISGSQHYETLHGERLRDYNCKRRMGNIVQPGHKSSNFRNAANPAVIAAPRERGGDAQRFSLTPTRANVRFAPTAAGHRWRPRPQLNRDARVEVPNTGTSGNQASEGTAPVSHQKRRQRNATKAIGHERKRRKINETDRHPPAHNGLVAGSNAFGIDNEINL